MSAKKPDSSHLAPNPKAKAKKPLADGNDLNRWLQWLLPPDHDDRPVYLALAGANGAGKSTIHAAMAPQLQRRSIPFLNVDMLTQMLRAEIPAIQDPATAGWAVTDTLRQHHVHERRSRAGTWWDRTSTASRSRLGGQLEHSTSVANCSVWQNKRRLALLKFDIDTLRGSDD